jgi:hypothetical protein
MQGKLIVVALAAALAAAGASVAFGSSPNSAPARTIKATLFYTDLTQVDVDHNGKPSVGDLAVAPGLYVNAAGKQIGTVFASCLQVNAAGTHYNCQDYNHFAGGDIITGDRFSPTEKTIHEAILGGTGVYAGVTGSVDGQWLKSDFSKAKVVFTLDS